MLLKVLEHYDGYLFISRPHHALVEECIEYVELFFIVSFRSLTILQTYQRLDTYAVVVVIRRRETIREQNSGSSTV